MFCAFVVCNIEDRSSRWSDCTDYSCSKQIVSEVLTCERITSKENTLYIASRNNNSADQTASMHRLVSAIVGRLKSKI